MFYKWLSFLLLPLSATILGQELNIVPNLLRPVLWNTEQLLPINLMANISEKLFHFSKIGLKFGA